MTTTQTTNTECNEHGSDWLCTREHPRFEDGELSPTDLERIHAFSSVPLRADQIYVRSMLIASTQPCETDGCQFTSNALHQIAERIVGQSVLSGHNRASLPLARFFKADVIPAEQSQQEHDVVRAWFYWLRDTSGAKDLLLNIDGGIYREVSLSWRFNHWRCSICNRENGQCSHQVGKSYDGKTCFRLIDTIVDVLEGSLVYKGADRNTVLNRAVSDHPFDEQPSVVLVAERDDPLLAFLDQHGLIHERIENPDEHFNESIDHLWVRSSNDALHETLARHISTDGVLLVESTEAESLRMQRRGDEGLVPVALEAQEDTHEPLR